MKTGFLALFLVVVTAVVSPALAQYAPKPVYPNRGLSPFLVNVPMQSFADFREFYASIQQDESRASIDNLRDFSGDPIIVVKLEQAEAPGLYAFYVMRERESRLRLLGQMNGFGYATSTASGHLEFAVDVGTRGPTQRFQVDGEFLVNLADLASLDTADPIALDVARGF